MGTLCSSEADDLMDELPSFQAKRHPFSLRYGPLNKPDVLAKWFQSAHRPSEEVSLSTTNSHRSPCGQVWPLHCSAALHSGLAVRADRLTTDQTSAQSRTPPAHTECDRRALR
jgi:hypothetical protein